MVLNKVVKMDKGAGFAKQEVSESLREVLLNCVYSLRYDYR